MMTRSKLRRWGNSLGIVVPKEVLEREGLREGEDVEISVRKIADVRSLRGKYPIKNLQRAKEEMRRGWSK